MVRSVRLLTAVAAFAGAVLLPANIVRAHGATCTVTASQAAVDTEEQKLLGLINQYRVTQGRPQVQLSQDAIRSAAWFSWDMATDNYFPPDHVDSNGRDIGSRLTWCGSSWTSYAENISAGFSGASETFEQWRNSPVHNTNLLSTAVTRVGIARHFNTFSNYDWYWTLTLDIEPTSPTTKGSAWYPDGASTKSGAVGTQVRVYATAASPNKTYQLVLGPPGCGTVTGVLNTAVRGASSSGMIGITVGTVPSYVPPGTYAVCFKGTAERTTHDITASREFKVI